MKSISFIIYSSNNASTVGRCVQSILETIPPGFKHFTITVYDKGSNDGTAGIIKKLRQEHDCIYEVLEQTEGLLLKDVFHDQMADYFIVMDGASIMEKDCIAILANALEVNEELMLAGAKIRLFNNTLSHAGRINEHIIGEEEESIFVRHLYYNHPESIPPANIPFEPEVLSTLCYALRKNDLFELFPDDDPVKDLTLSELSFRIRSKGRKISYHPDAVLTRLNDLDQKGFLFSIKPADLAKFSQLEGFEKKPARIPEDIRIALEENLIGEIFSAKKSGFKGHFRMEKAEESISYEYIKLIRTDKQARIYFPRVDYGAKKNLIIMAELEVEAKTTLRLKYSTISDPTYSDKKSYLTYLYPGNQFRLFCLPSDHLSGELCFEFPGQNSEIIIRNIGIYHYPEAGREQSLVSVVIPCYNHGEFLDEALESLKSINREKYEVIIVDDGSDDPETLEKFRELEAKGYYIFHQENKGLGTARNEGIRLARGNYILPLDSDNLLRTIYIERGIEILDMHKRIGVVYGDVQRFGDSDERVSVPEFDPVQQMIQNTIDACGLFRKCVWEEVGGYETNMVGYQDWAFWLAIAATGNWNFHHIDDVVFDYRVRTGSMVSNTKRYHYPMQDYILTRNISFVREQMQQLYKMKKTTIQADERPLEISGHQTVLGSLKIHLRHFYNARIKRNKIS